MYLYMWKTGLIKNAYEKCLKIDIYGPQRWSMLFTERVLFTEFIKNL